MTCNCPDPLRLASAHCPTHGHDAVLNLKGEAMAEYRIEWQMGGEARIDVGWPHTDDEVRKAVEATLAGIAEDVAGKLADEVNAGVVSYDGTAEATVHRLT